MICGSAEKSPCRSAAVRVWNRRFPGAERIQSCWYPPKANNLFFTNWAAQCKADLISLETVGLM